MFQENKALSSCIETLLSGEELITKDLKRRYTVIKFFAEWIEKLESEHAESSAPLAGLIHLVFERQFHSENSHEINLTLLEILPYYNKKDQLFSQVAQLTKH